MGMPDFYMISLKNVWVLSRRRISSGIPFPLVAVCIPLKKIKNHAVMYLGLRPQIAGFVGRALEFLAIECAYLVPQGQTPPE